ncbi:MAG: DUF3486 family protein [Alphaproteobacteria bacterium]
MPRRSSIKRLPPEIRELIADLRENGRTLDEILGKLRELSVNLPRSTLGRYVQDLEKISERVQKSRHVAEALVKRFGDAPESKAARLNIELMHGIIMDMVIALEEPDPMGAMLASKALDHLARAERANAETIERARKSAINDAVKAMRKAGKQKGLSPEAIQEMETAMGLVR